MNNKYSRREFLGRTGLTGVALGLGSQGLLSGIISGESENSAAGQVSVRGSVQRSGKVIQPECELPVRGETDVLVIGGGSAGVAAAVTAQRLGVRVVLTERYGCFGGLFTAGMVLLLEGTYTNKDGKKFQVARGFNDELLRGLRALGKDGLLEEGGDPTADPEAAKYLLSEMVRQSGVKVLLHCWGVDVVMDGDKIGGVVFESKSGRQAILAKVVVDASGDGDIFAAAGAGYSKHLRNVGLVHRTCDPAGRDLAGLKTPLRGVSWVNMRGERVDALDIDDLTRLEMNYRKHIWETVQRTKKVAGYENIFLLDTASQIGVRTSRLLLGIKQPTPRESRAGKFKDVVGVASPPFASRGGAENQVYIPYGSLVPQKINGLLSAGRCVGGRSQHETLRLVPACFTTGQAVGAAAAISVKDGCEPRQVNIEKLQSFLREQDAYLG